MIRPYLKHKRNLFFANVVLVVSITLTFKLNTRNLLCMRNARIESASNIGSENEDENVKFILNDWFWKVKYVSRQTKLHT